MGHETFFELVPAIDPTKPNLPVCAYRPATWSGMSGLSLSSDEHNTLKKALKTYDRSNLLQHAYSGIGSENKTFVDDSVSAEVKGAIRANLTLKTDVVEAL